jgi:hypothetical protein
LTDDDIVVAWRGSTFFTAPTTRSTSEPPLISPAASPIGLASVVSLVSGIFAGVFRLTEPIREVIERDVEYDEPPVVH